MLQVAQSYKTGLVALEEVPTPLLKPGGVIVRSLYSLISAGTEGAKVRQAKMNLIEKARARPDQVRQVLQTVQQQGVTAAYQKVMNRLETLSPLGYSLAGVVEAVGDGAHEFEVGQIVACAGADYANHAELNFVPKRLVAAVPQGVSPEHAAFTTVGSIAMHGFRQGDLRLGEIAVVVGLGLVGQLLSQLLSAAGVRVFGVDLDPGRVELAEHCGAEACGRLGEAAWRDALMRASGGAGADCVFLTVGSSQNDPLDLAAELVRDRGRIVVVGKTKADLDYERFFKKEIDVRFSRSYGPGRYDRSYEEKGHDYPLSYVRWTEGRNLAAFLQLLRAKRIDVAPLISEVRPFSDAVETYEQMNAGALKGVGVLFRFDAVADRPAATAPRAKSATPVEGDAAQRVGLGVIGAGNYAGSMLLPHLKADPAVTLIATTTARALSAANAKQKFGFERFEADHDGIFSDPQIDGVVIATPHSTHASLVCDALRAGKSVFVEKPLAIDEAGLEAVCDVVRETGNDRLMVGFNRRHAPIMRDLKARLTGAPLNMIYRVHAGAAGGDGWHADSDQGGRFIGEAGHFLDVFAYLTDASLVSVTGATQRPSNPSPDDLQNITVTLRYADGSVGTLLYLTQGGQRTPKERLEVFAGGDTLIMDNFASLNLYHARGVRKQLGRYGGDKGQKAEMASFVAATRGAAAFPTSFAEIVEVTRATLYSSAAALRNVTLFAERPPEGDVEQDAPAPSLSAAMADAAV